MTTKPAPARSTYEDGQDGHLNINAWLTGVVVAAVVVTILNSRRLKARHAIVVGLIARRRMESRSSPDAVVTACGCDCHSLGRGSEDHCGRCAPRAGADGAAHVVLRVDLPDGFDRLTAYGVGQIAVSLLDHLSGWDSSEEVEYRLVEVDGPDEPRECMKCGCEPHVDLPCPSCTHPLCR